MAVALMGADRAEALAPELKPEDVLRRGAKEGHIRIHFTADAQPLEVRLTPDRIAFDDSTARPRLMVLGFGSSRWLPRPGGFHPDTDDAVRVKNLFNPFVPLADTLGWLGGLSKSDFARVEGALLRILQLDEGQRLVRREGEVLLHESRARSSHDISLHQLSDGYQAVMAMVGDIMELLIRKRADISVAEGLVLVDELEAHLHPRWKMQIVSRLRAAFPRMQFVTTTHDPLCLRGLGPDEVVLLRRGRRVPTVATQDLPSVEGLRVDQLLTSPHFGLHSTIDPELETGLDEYYELISLDRRTQAQGRRLEELQEELDTRDVLGTTRRERELYRAIDTKLARKAKALEPEKDVPLNSETSVLLAKILDDVDELT
jgi:hypothetical protein